LLVIPNWELVEITSKDVGGIMDGIACPVESFAKSVWRVKGSLEFFDTLL